MSPADYRELESRFIVAKVMARRLWAALQARSGLEAAALFSDEAVRLVEPIYDAVESVWERHRVLIETCRRILDERPTFGGTEVPYQNEMYFGRWPDGTTRNLTRAQVLMMGGQDPEQ